MNLSMHEASVPVFRRLLANLSGLLERTKEHISTHRLDETALLQQRLYPDMFPLPRQVQIACDAARFAVARLAGRQAPSIEDTESTLVELQGRIAATLGWLDGFDEAALAASADREVEVKIRDRVVRLRGAEYLTQFALPNFCFHVTTAYAILRHNGVLIGKKDYLGEFG